MRRFLRSSLWPARGRLRRGRRFDWLSRGLLCGSALEFVRHIRNAEAQIPWIRGERQSSFEIDDAIANQFLDVAIEVLHAFLVAVAHAVEQRLPFLLASLQIFAGAQGRREDFDNGHAAARFLRDETLRNDVAETFREARTNHL